MVEVWGEVENSEMTDGLELEPELAIRYPAAFYFFVNKSNITLARLLTDGLEKAIADGSFDQLFNNHFEDHLRKADFDGRKVFELENPLLTEQTPVDRKELWYKPEKTMAAYDADNQQSQ